MLIEKSVNQNLNLRIGYKHIRQDSEKFGANEVPKIVNGMICNGGIEYHE